MGKKVRTALNEVRTLILGAQLRLGFQYHSTFQVASARWRLEKARMFDGFALGLMLATIGFLIAPTALHRIAEGRESTAAIMELTGRCAAAALLPFSLALALDLAIALTLAFGNSTAGGVAGGIFAALALGSWFAVGYIVMCTLAHRRPNHHGGAGPPRGRYGRRCLRRLSTHDWFPAAERHHGNDHLCWSYWPPLDPATTGPGKGEGRMGTVHRLVIEHGREAAMKKVDPAERHLVRIAADILAEDDDAIGVTYSGFCQASLPHIRQGCP
jgi:hypothetical protein